MEVEHAPTEAKIKEHEEAAQAATAQAQTATAQAQTATAQAQATTQGGALSPAYVFAPPVETYPRDTAFAPVVPPLALGAIAFAIVGLIIWAGLRMTQAAATRNGYTQAMNHEMAEATEPTVPGAGYPPAQPIRGRTAYAPAPPPFNRALVTGPFLGDENRKAAKESLQPLHALIALFRKYDTDALWTNALGSAPSASGPIAVTMSATVNAPGLPPGGVAPVTFPGAPGAVGTGGGGGGTINQTRGATFQSIGTGAGAATSGVVAAEKFSDTVDHIHFRTEALATQIDMTATPDTYPAPLRGDVKAMSQELRSYLKDADIAPTQDAATRSLLRQKATQRLANADQWVTYMEGVVDGTADANHPPLFNR